MRLSPLQWRGLVIALIAGSLLASNSGLPAVGVPLAIAAMLVAFRNLFETLRSFRR